MPRVRAVVAVSVFVAFSSVGSPLPAQQPPPVVTPSQRTAAQDAAASMGRPVTNEAIADAIRRSGMTEAQVRARLQSAGYDPSLADPFFQGAGGRGGAGGAGAAAPSDAFVRALQEVGVLAPPADTAVATPPDSPGPTDSAYAARGLQVFGTSLFHNRATQFDPTTTGPVDPSYRLGVGDQVQIVFTGQVEAVYTFDVRRDGTIILPDVGQLAVSGLTLDAARGLLKARGARAYSGLSSGKTQVDLSVTRLRTSLVYVVGEVLAPGAYQVNALATVLTALARAGGPTNAGSFRHVEVRRAGRVAATVDLYDYLMSGNGERDIRIEQGDIVFVPLSGKQIGISGEVRRPGVYELAGGEGFQALLRYAGDLRATASLKRIQVDRILPAPQRSRAHERVFVDIVLDGDLRRANVVELADHDLVEVFPVTGLRRNSVAVSGAVVAPGVYELHKGMSVADAVAAAQGLLPWGVDRTVKVYRSLLDRGIREEHALDLRDAAQAKFELSEFDMVEVLDSRRSVPPGKVEISGAVSHPSEHDFREGETLLDLIDIAGGLREEAATIEVARRQRSDLRSDTAAIVYRFAVKNRAPQDSLAARRFLLLRDDRVIVRANPGYRASEFVSVTGAFTYPGTYVVESDSETVRTLIQRAGGLLPSADPRSFRLVRLGRAVPIELPRVMAGEAHHNLKLYPGDQIRVSAGLGVVFVGGAVERQVAVPYSRDKSVEDYIIAAGGRTTLAQRDVVVELPSGRVERTRRILLVARSHPAVEEGATVTVLSRPAPTGAPRDVLTTVMQVAGTMASLVIAVVVARR